MLRVPFLLCIGIAALACAAAAPAQTQFNLSGSITQDTCQWSVGDDNRTIALDPINANYLTTQGSGNFKPFTLTVEKCSAFLTSATFAFSGTSDANNQDLFGNTGTAANVAVMLQSADDNAIISPRSSGSNSRTISMTGNQAVIRLRAGYAHSGAQPAREGTVSSVAQVTVSYN